MKEPDKENPAALEALVTKNILHDILGVQVKTVERMHRIGLKKAGRQRPIIVRFYDFAEKMTVLHNCSKLKGSEISISEDFSARIRDVHRKLWKASADNRSNGKKVALLYDRIKIDDNLCAWNNTENKLMPLGRSKCKGTANASISRD